MVVLDSDRRHSTITIEINIVFEDRRIAMIRLDAIECSVDFWWNCAIDLEVYDISFQARRSVVACEDVCVRELELIRLSFTAGVDR
jgi:hypothetical protein